METKWAERERGETSLETGDQAGGQERAQATWLCQCVNCEPKPTDLESDCCPEWDLVTTQLQDQHNYPLKASLWTHSPLTEYSSTLSFFSAFWTKKQMFQSFFVLQWKMMCQFH